ncbi:unnamed protein product [Symbiodinium sp. CCMP2456]|nr:unnamed protein product [Symbiodinium sp. CCMP2456]
MEIALKVTAVAIALAVLFVGMFPDLSAGMVFFLLMDIPTAVFATFLMFGQHLTNGQWGPSVWVDKICVSQTDEEAKQQGIAGLPTVVACSSRLLVLWDGTYFERLWCNLELSVFVKCSGVKNVRFLPLWLAPWLLTMLCVTYLEQRLQALAVTSNPYLGDDVVSPRETGVEDAGFGWHHLLVFQEYTQASLVFYVLLAVASVFTFQQKLDGHKLMLEHLKSYDIRTAKCSVESDRPVIEGLVAELFDGLDDPVVSVPFETDTSVAEAGHDLPVASLSLSPEDRLAIRSVTGYLNHEDCLATFNDYMRGIVRESVLEDLGRETDVSWSICVLSFLPTVLYCLGFSWACKSSYATLGFTSSSQMLMVVTVQYGIFGTIAMPAVHPLLLCLMDALTARTEAGCFRVCLSLWLALLVYSFVLALFGLVAGALESWVITQQNIFLVVFFMGLFLPMLLSCLAFRRDWRMPHFSCRCLNRAPAASDYDALP